MKTRSCFLLLAALILLLAGCGDGIPKRYPVEGQVVFEDGTPVKTGIVEFLSADKKYSATGNIQRDGSFRLTTLRDYDGAIAGEHYCIVKQFIVFNPDDGVVHNHGGHVKAYFADYKTSPLTFTVNTRKTEIKIVVEEDLD